MGRLRPLSDMPRVRKDQATEMNRCVLPKCGTTLNEWPGICSRVKGHDGRHGPPNPFLVADPWWGTLICHVCGKEIFADEPYRKVVRFWWIPGRGGWRHAFAHDVDAFS